MKQFIPVFKAANLHELMKTYHLEKTSLVKCSIGYDGGIYLLFSAKIPERIEGMFVNTQANTEYKALCLWMDWEDGSLLGVDELDLGFQRMNFHFIQPVGDLILLLGARATQYKARGIKMQYFSQDRAKPLEPSVLRMALKTALLWRTAEL